jgi:predicted ArsR family transcriptional regulator
MNKGIGKATRQTLGYLIERVQWRQDDLAAARRLTPDAMLDHLYRLRRAGLAERLPGRLLIDKGGHRPVSVRSWKATEAGRAYMAAFTNGQNGAKPLQSP